MVILLVNKKDPPHFYLLAAFSGADIPDILSGIKRITPHCRTVIRFNDWGTRAQSLAL
jgi:hypothetical protein